MLLSRTFRPWLVLAALQVADVLTTAIAINTRAAAEGNAFAAHIIASYGQPLAYTLKLTGIALVITALYHYRTRTWSRTALFIAIGLSSVAVVNNTLFLLSSHP